MTYSRKKSKQYLLKAKKILPQGVTSNFRYEGDEWTLTVKEGRGAYIWDLDDNKYLDMRMGFGPVILGHGFPRVNEAVKRAIDRGTTFAANQEMEFELASKINQYYPSLEKLRFCNSGTEATMHALRVARAFTGKDDIVKFEGMYHGFHDYLLYSTYSRVDRLGPKSNPDPRRSSWGIPDVIKDLVYTIPFNDIDVLQRQLRYWSEEIAAVIVEPIMGNCNGIMPQKGFLEKLRELCTELNIVLIFDEVKTGFRDSIGGAQEMFNIKPDLACFAKAIGNGYPVAAFGGRNDLMENIRYGGVAQGGTYAGNAVGLSAGIETIKTMEEENVHEKIRKVGKMLMTGIKDICDKNEVPVQVTGIPAMFGFAFTDQELKDYRSWAQSDADMYYLVSQKMRERGIWYELDSREPFFLSYSHTEGDVDFFLQNFQDVIVLAKEEKAKMPEKDETPEM